MSSTPSSTDLSLKLARAAASAPETTTLAAERQALQEDLEALRQREENLRAYERRLRELQAELDARTGAPTRGSRTPFAGVAKGELGDVDALKAGWEKLHRAREIFEAEQAVLRDDRLAVREHEQQLRDREHALAEREAKVAAREEALQEAMNARAGQPGREAKASRSPFQFARAVLRGSKHA